MPSKSQTIYVVNDAATSGGGHCTLEDGGTVICQFDRMQAALAATAGDPALRLVQREELTFADQRRVEQALLQ